MRHRPGSGTLDDVTALTVRKLTADDVEAIVELNTLCDIAETGQPDHEVLSWIRDGAEDYTAFGIDDEAGLAACSWIDVSGGGHTGFETDVRVRPGLDPSIGQPLLDAARAVADGADPTKPLHLFTNHSGARARHWLESIGAVEVRHFWRMQIDLGDTPPVVPLAPGSVSIRNVRDDDDDLRVVFDVVDTAFAEHFGHAPGESYENWIRQWRMRSSYDVSLWRVAELDGAVVAALLAATIEDAGHVSTLGTLKAARGLGIGGHLLRVAFAEFHRRGYRRVQLGVDAANETGAVHLYESVGMHEVHQWVLYELAP
jgi:mycothiol synthase